MRVEEKERLRLRRHRRVRSRVTGTANRPRLSVSRSLKHIYVQLIDDAQGHTLVAASSRDTEVASQKVSGGNLSGAVAVGKLIADRAKQAGVGAVVFDRGGYKYHGRVKALADAARAGGLSF
ncbi:MAG: 50S ribosomal protein L18 [Armatimonadetes bacterium]|nr:50S ribosomal protein L18 [Armatimonadota bacterium]MDE2206868.1 50S ribosomal protein L18 [Armatimonadota bacterium]